MEAWPAGTVTSASGEWQQGMNVALMYGFTYDGVNRLKETTQKQKSGTTWSTLAGSYLERGLTYDRNGNLKTLQRTAGGTLVDNLVYTCTGNRLTKFDGERFLPRWRGMFIPWWYSIWHLRL